MQLRRLATPAAAFSAAALSLFFTLSFTAPVQAQSQPACGSKAYLEGLPVPPPQDPNIKRQVQLINCSHQVLLGAATASHAEGAPGWPIFPQSGTWVMQPYTPGSTLNVLTIDIPSQWYGQHVKGQTSNFWARTGCRYDPVTNRAQCETGDCGGQYDCSSGNLGAPPGTTLSEWTFYQSVQGYHMDFPDISAVNGANLTIDVYPRGSDPMSPISKTDFHWLAYNWPLTVHGQDLREPGRCEAATNGRFTLLRSDIDQTVSKLPNYPLLGYVIVDGDGNPTMPGGNNVLACFSNCGKYKFPMELGSTGCNVQTDENCYAWKTFCAGDKDVTYGQCCTTDADCPQNGSDENLHVACFQNAGPNQKICGNQPGVCEIRAFYKGSVSQCNGKPDPQHAAPASKIACNNTYGSINPLAKPTDPPPIYYDYGDQPIVGNCSDVIFSGTNQPVACIGDDTLHAVLHGAYTWPNDPEVFGGGTTAGDGPIYQIVFAPEGEGNAPITPAQPLPDCDSLPPNYLPAHNRGNCSIPINDQFADFGIGVVQNAGAQKWQSSGVDWPCSAGSQRASGDNGVICRWNPPPTDHCSLTGPGGVCNCTPPVTDDNVTHSACGRIDSGMSLVSGIITPNSGDPLFLEVSIACNAFMNGTCLNPVNVPPSSSISGCVPAQGVGAWTLVASQAINTHQGIIAWYKGTSNTSVDCQVAVSTATSNPGELKVYDVPKFNGTFDGMSTASGTYTAGPPPDISAGSLTTKFPKDLQLGALLQVNLTPTPITYYQNWLTNAPTSGSDTIDCMPHAQNTDCPREDGTDYLPGHGPYSGNSDVGHNLVTNGTEPQYFHRHADIVAPDPVHHVLGSNFAWVGVAIYVELAP